MATRSRRVTVADLDPGLTVRQTLLLCFICSLVGKADTQTSMFRESSLDTETLGKVPEAAQHVPCSLVPGVLQGSQPHRMLPLGSCLLWPWAPSPVFPDVLSVAPGIVTALLWWALSWMQQDIG